MCMDVAPSVAPRSLTAGIVRLAEPGSHLRGVPSHAYFSVEVGSPARVRAASTWATLAIFSISSAPSPRLLPCSRVRSMSPQDEQPVGPLSWLRVVDLTDLRGALCARILADLGADVVRVGSSRRALLLSCSPTSTATRTSAASCSTSIRRPAAVGWNPASRGRRPRGKRRRRRPSLLGAGSRRFGTASSAPRSRRACRPRGERPPVVLAPGGAAGFGGVGNALCQRISRPSAVQRAGLSRPRLRRGLWRDRSRGSRSRRRTASTAVGATGRRQRAGGGARRQPTRGRSHSTRTPRSIRCCRPWGSAMPRARTGCCPPATAGCAPSSGRRGNGTVSSPSCARPTLSRTTCGRACSSGCRTPTSSGCSPRSGSPTGRGPNCSMRHWRSARPSACCTRCGSSSTTRRRRRDRSSWTKGSRVLRGCRSPHIR